MKVYYLFTGLIILFNFVLAGAQCVAPGDNAASTFDYLQAVLDSNADLVLCQKELYEIDDVLTYKFQGQKISTENATLLSDNATIRTVNRDVLLAIKAHGQHDVVLDHVNVDGNRYRIGAKDKIDGEPALLQFGNRNNHTVTNGIFMNTRTWSTLQFIEGAGTSEGHLAENNLILGAGPDSRGNGLSENENPDHKAHWGDCISLAARNTTIRNNYLMEPTDLGVAIFSAMGSVIEKNVASSWSREAFAAFDMLDGLDVYEIGLFDGKPLYDYTGTVVRDNYIDSYGSRMHTGIALGQPVWQSSYRKVMQGGAATGNVLTGGAFGYGIAAHALNEFTVTGNVSTAIHSGRGHISQGRTPDESMAFQYKEDRIWNSEFQSDFVAAESHFMQLLRNRTGEGTRDGGFLVASPYGDLEAVAIVQGAYVEILQRMPTADETREKKDWLQQITQDEDGRDRNLHRADDLRRVLMETDEFQDKFGPIDVTLDNLQLYRVDVWQDALTRRIDAAILATGSFPPITDVYKNIVDVWEGKIEETAVRPQNKLRVFTFSLNTGLTLHRGSTGKIESLSIYSHRGSRLKKISLTGAARNIVWDGKDESGRALSPGVYPVRVLGHGTSHSFLINLAE